MENFPSRLRYAVLALACAVLFGCAQLPPAPAPAPEPAAPAATPPAPAPGASPPAAPATRSAAGAEQRGRVSRYAGEFAGKKTASGAIYDPAELTMAHRTLPFGTRVRVTNLENQRSVEVVVNDRGPFVAGRIADLSEAAARQIDMITDGVVEALVVILAPGSAR